jgi:hypothetical protein
MKRASYRTAVQWIADNDEPTITDPAEMDGLISVLLVADLFEVESSKVAADVIALRKKASGKPAYGTQEWAETRGDDLGESPDY